MGRNQELCQRGWRAWGPVGRELTWEGAYPLSIGCYSEGTPRSLGGSSWEALQAESWTWGCQPTSGVCCKEAQAVAACYPSLTLDTF